MIFKIITLVYIITKSSRCSMVNDVLKQESIVMSKDCPNQRHCRQGTHVVCMYYDRNQLFGPRCKNLVKVEVTPNMVHHILTNINYLRENIATGVETGKYDEVLPRAYGLMKLKWDKELAFSAQVLANQCLGYKEDECRATDKFSNPSQTIGVIRYKYPNWEYLKTKSTEKGLDEIKLIFAVDTFLRSAQTSKRNVTKDNIMNSPPLNKLVDVNLKNYLNLIHGGVTHIGCGVSAYSSKINGSNNTGSKQNIVQIVCNFSDAPKHNQPVYEILPPIPGQGYSKRCGCQRGYKETRNCLCERDLKNLRKGLQYKNQLSFKKNTRRSLKNHSNIEAVLSEKEERKANGQQARYIISKSRDFIVLPSFRRNLLRDRKVPSIQAMTSSKITNATMTSRFTHEQKKERKETKKNDDDNILGRYASHPPEMANTEDTLLRKRGGGGSKSGGHRGRWHSGRVATGRGPGYYDVKGLYYQGNPHVKRPPTHKRGPGCFAIIIAKIKQCFKKLG